jgi:hypothetical protein
MLTDENDNISRIDAHGKMLFVGSVQKFVTVKINYTTVNKEIVHHDNLSQVLILLFDNGYSLTSSKSQIVSFVFIVSYRSDAELRQYWSDGIWDRCRYRTCTNVELDEHLLQFTVLKNIINKRVS